MFLICSFFSGRAKNCLECAGRQTVSIVVCRLNHSLIDRQGRCVWVCALALVTHFVLVYDRGLIGINKQVNHLWISCCLLTVDTVRVHGSNSLLGLLLFCVGSFCSAGNLWSYFTDQIHTSRHVHLSTWTSNSFCVTGG